MVGHIQVCALASAWIPCSLKELKQRYKASSHSTVCQQHIHGRKNKSSCSLARPHRYNLKFSQVHNK